MKPISSLTARPLLMVPLVLALGCARASSADGDQAAASRPAKPPISLVTLNGDEFNQRVLKSAKPVVVDFFSPECMICKSVEPVLADVADEYRDQIDVFKIDIFQDDALADKYDVDLPPVFLIFRDGEIVAQLGGPISKGDLVAKLQPLLKG